MRTQGVPAEVDRRLLAHLDDLNASDPVDRLVGPGAGHLRHLCPRSRTATHTGRATSVSLDVAERYVLDPIDDRYAWIWREGRCRSCGLRVRSAGVAVVAASRPALRRSRG